jgi:hypothetical protein
MAGDRKMIEREIRGIPYFLLFEYLEEMGGTAVGEDLIEAPEWRATFERMEPFRIGSLEVGQTRLKIEIEQTAEEEFLRVFSLKTFRAGG